MKENYTFFKTMLLSVALWLFCSVNLFAIDYYWTGKGENSNWNTIQNWSTTSGGMPDFSSLPTTNDNVIFDENSFIGSDYAQRRITVNTTAWCDSIIFKGLSPFGVPILTINSNMIIKGSMLLCPEMTIQANGALLSFQSTRENETLGYYDGVTRTLAIPNSILISQSANWTINGSLTLSLSAGCGNFVFYSIGNLTINGGLTIAECSISGGGNVVINGNVSSSTSNGRFYFSAPNSSHASNSYGGDGDLTINGDLRVVGNGTLNSSGGDVYFGGTGSKNITGNLSMIYYTYSAAEYGPVTIGGYLLASRWTAGSNHTFDIKNGCIFTIEGYVDKFDLNSYSKGGIFNISGAGSQMIVKDYIKGYSLTVADQGTLNNYSNKDIFLDASFSCNNGIVLGVAGCTVHCGISWSNTGQDFTPATTPALIRIDRGGLTATAGDHYHNVEFHDISSRHNIAKGTYNKITYFGGDGEISAVTTDTLIITPQREFSFLYTPTHINKRLEIVPRPCGGMISVRNGTIVMGSNDVEVQNVRMENVTITGATPTALKSVDAGSNTGWIFSSAGDTCYWVGGAGDWDDGAHWADVSGGAPGSGCIPTIFDDAVFDENSELNGTATVSTNEATAYCNNMTWKNITGNPTFLKTENSYLYIGGSLELNPGMNFNYFARSYSTTQVWFVSNGTGNTIKSNGVVFSNETRIAFHSGYIEKGAPNVGQGEWTLLDDLTISNSAAISSSGLGEIIFERGNLNFGGKNVTANCFISNTSWNRTLNIANSVITLTPKTYNSSVSTGWLYLGGKDTLTSAQTINSLIRINGRDRWSAGSSAIYYGFQTKVNDVYYNLELNSTIAYSASSPTCGKIIEGVFNKITLTGLVTAKDIMLEGTNLRTDSLFLSGDLGFTYTLNTNITVNKYFQGPQECGLMSFLRANGNTARTITMGSTGIADENVKLKNMQINRVHIQGGPMPLEGYPAPDCELLNNPTGWDAYSSSGNQRYYWIGGEGNWTDMKNWSHESGGEPGAFCTPPKPENTVVFDENSFSAPNQNVIVSYTAYCDSMQWLNIPEGQNPQLNLSASYTLTISGSALMHENMTISGQNGTLAFNSPRPNETFKTCGINFTCTYIKFNNAGEMDIPDGLSFIRGSSGSGGNIYFGESTFSQNAVWKFGAPLIAKFNGNGLNSYVSVSLAYGTLDLSGSGAPNWIDQFSGVTPARLIIKDATISVAKYSGSTMNGEYGGWRYSGTLLASDSENSTINIARPVAMTTASNQVYNNVNFELGGTLNASTTNTLTEFNRVIFHSTDIGRSGTVTGGKYQYLRFKSSATIASIHTDTLYFNNSEAYTYTFASDSTSYINSRWYGSGTPTCYRVTIRSSDANGSPNPAYIMVNKAAATLNGDTLFMDAVRLNGLVFTTGDDCAKILVGPDSPVELDISSRDYNTPAYVKNCTFLAYDPYFRRLGPDVMLCRDEYPFELSSVYYVITPESTFEWKKGTTNGVGGVGLNENPESDRTTLSWFIQSPDPDTETYFLRVSYPLQTGTPCNLQAYKTISHTPPSLLSDIEECSGNNIDFELEVIHEHQNDLVEWTRESVPGITPDTGNGEGYTINETLINNNPHPTEVTYVFTIDTGTCTTITEVHIMVNPKPAAPKKKGEGV